MNIETRIYKIDIAKRVHALAGEIDKHYGALSVRRSNAQPTETYVGVDQIVLVGVLKGCVPFIGDLSRWLEVPHQIDYVRVKSYKGTQAGNVQVVWPASDGLGGRDVLIVEDIIDTGGTLAALTNEIRSQGPRSLEVVALCNKRKVIPMKEQLRVQPKPRARFIGFGIDPGEFVVGYGLDYNELYRNLSYIGVISDRP